MKKTCLFLMVFAIAVAAKAQYPKDLFLTDPASNSGSGTKLILGSGSSNGQVHSIGINNYWTEFRSHVNEGWRFVTGNDNVTRMELSGRSGNLSVSGDLFLTDPASNSGSGTKLILGSGSSNGQVHSIGINNYWTEFRSHVNEGWRFITGNDDVARLVIIGRNGHVGIGTSDPKSKLSVNGEIRAREINVLTNVGRVPDYVFEDDYELMTLQEIRDYVTEYKHLPEIPSASEFGKEGLDLGDMNMRLLKKIEELTLHLIEQSEKIEELSLQNQDQRQEIELLKSEFDKK